MSPFPNPLFRIESFRIRLSNLVFALAPAILLFAGCGDASIDPRSGKGSADSISSVRKVGAQPQRDLSDGVPEEGEDVVPEVVARALQAVAAAAERGITYQRADDLLRPLASQVFSMSLGGSGACCIFYRFADLYMLIIGEGYAPESPVSIVADSSPVTQWPPDLFED